MNTSLHIDKLPGILEAKALLSSFVGVHTEFTPGKTDRPVALYGAGNLGKMAWEYFDTLGVPVEFVVDAKADQYTNDVFWEGIDVVSQDVIVQSRRDSVVLAICVVTTAFTVIAESLKNSGWDNVVPFYDLAETYRDRHPLSNGWFAGRFSNEDMANISCVIEKWGDDLSRAHHLQFMAWRSLRQDWMFTDGPVDTMNRYFIPEITELVHTHENFIDVGANVGTTTMRFLELVRHDFERVYLIEPDHKSRVLLEKYLSRMSVLDRDRVEIVPLALAESDRESSFFGGLGYASQLSSIGMDIVSVTSLDKLNISPTFIKLHIEGGELAALEGAQNTLSRCRPIITLTAYHNADGIWELPKWLMEHLEQYRFLFRLHGWCGTGAVIYCIPNEREKHISLDIKRENILRYADLVGNSR